MGERNETVFTIYTPSRKSRRELNGQPCCACGLRVHFSEVQVIQVGFQSPLTIHGACVELLQERYVQESEELAMTQAGEQLEEDAAALPGPNPQDTTDAL